MIVLRYVGVVLEAIVTMDADDYSPTPRSMRV